MRPGYHLTAIPNPSPAADVDRLLSRDDRLAQLQERVDALENRLRATEMELMARRVYPLVVEMLGILDDLQRAVQASQSDAEVIRDGVRMIASGMTQAFSRHGIEPITAAYQPFDPRFHEAVAQEQRPGVPAGYVLVEVQRGFMMRGHVLRPTKVVVSA